MVDFWWPFLWMVWGEERWVHCEWSACLELVVGFVFVDVVVVGGRLTPL